MLETSKKTLNANEEEKNAKNNVISFLRREEKTVAFTINIGCQILFNDSYMQNVPLIWCTITIIWLSAMIGVIHCHISWLRAIVHRCLFIHSVCCVFLSVSLTLCVLLILYLICTFVVGCILCVVIVAHM